MPSECIMERILQVINRSLVLLAGIFLVLMILLTCANIFLRVVWVPVRGTYELMGYFGAVVAAFALGHTQLTRGHIAVDVLYRKFPAPVAKGLTVFNCLFCTGFFAVMAWQLVLKGNILMQTGEVTETLRIAYYPFTYGVAAGCGFLALVFFKQLAEVLRPERGKTP